MSEIDFPSNPNTNDTFSFAGKTWIFNGQAWDIQDSGFGHGHTASNVVDSFNGITGDVDTTSLTLPVAGLSGVGGITFSD